MQSVINMQKLERKHYLKRFVGGFAMVLDEGQSLTGEIEQVDMEDGSVLMKCGERSQWVEGWKVTPSLKQFKDLTDQDIETIFSNALFRGRYHQLVEYRLIRTNDNFVGYASEGLNLYMTKDWNIYAMHTKDNYRIDCSNTGQIIFLLCELGYDVTGIFHS